jgi:hypothetical protein
MKLQVRSFLLALAMAGAAMAGHAQNGAASKADIDRCTDWLKTVLPDNMKVDVALFCAGQKQEQVPGLGGWYSTYHCGPAAGPAADRKEPYCAVSGAISPNWALAAGFRSEIKDGGDIMPAPGKVDAAGAAGTFYSLTPVHIGSLRVPAGLYRFTISHPADGWKMTVAPETGTEIGVVSLKPSSLLTTTDSALAIGVLNSGFRCKDPVRVHELVISYSGTELYACFEPEPIAPAQESVAAR